MDEANKRCIMMAILAFHITFILFTVLFNSTWSPFRGIHFGWLKMVLGLLIAAGAATGGYFGAKMTQ